MLHLHCSLSDITVIIVVEMSRKWRLLDFVSVCLCDCCVSVCMSVCMCEQHRQTYHSVTQTEQHWHSLWTAALQNLLHCESQSVLHAIRKYALYINTLCCVVRFSEHSPTWFAWKMLKLFSWTQKAGNTVVQKYTSIDRLTSGKYCVCEASLRKNYSEVYCDC